jgi:hypothetical protein
MTKTFLSYTFIAAVGAFFLGATDCNDGTGFCDAFCTDYTSCVDSGQHGDTTLFCGLDESARHEACVSSCRASTERLGESESAFTTCAQCVVKYVNNNACSDSDLEEIAATSCTESCKASAAGRGASAFESTFHASFDKEDMGSCHRTGTVTFAATDDKIGHKVGEPSGSSWVCTSNCDYSHIMYGPYVGLPPGTYRAGFRGVSLGGTIGSNAAVIDIYCGGEIAQQTLTASDVSSSELGIDFTLDAMESSCEVRLLLLDSNTTASIRSTFITRVSE